MKKLFFIIVAALSVVSCSGDDSKTLTRGIVTFTVDGKQLVFDDVNVYPSQNFQWGNEDYRSIFSTKGGDAIRITFPITEEATNGGGDVNFTEQGNDFFELNAHINYTENSKHRISGTFNGTFTNGQNGIDEKKRTITNGTFDVRY